MLPQSDIERIKAAAENAKPTVMAKYAGSDLETLVNECISPNPPPGEQVKERLRTIDKAPYSKDRPVYKNGKLSGLLQLLVPGVDETVEDGVTFRGFGRFNGVKLMPFLGQAKDSVTKLKQLAVWCHSYITDFACLGEGKPSEQQTWTQTHYQLWFDEKVERHHLQKVKTVYEKLNQQINKETFEVLCDGADGKDPIIFSQRGAESVHAFVVKSENLNRIYLCERFFHEEEHKGKRICTLLHELTHLEHIGDTEDDPKLSDDEVTMKQNARTAPQIACNNAENFARFAAELLKKGVIIF